MDEDTISALATPAGRGGIAVIRISGGNSLSIIKQLTGTEGKTRVPGRMYHGFIRENGSKVDECMYVFFKGPKSYTGEDSAEISTHSNPFIVNHILNLINRSGARMALGGEFTYRAYKNGKLDLIQAESVNELINANSAYYAKMKFSAVEGRLSSLVNGIRKDLIDLGVRIETIIEFQEDNELEEIGFAEFIDSALNKVRGVLESRRFGDTLDTGLKVVLAGRVNAGKSSLFNYLLKEERSIISSLPGTTRDYIKERVYLGGYPFTVTDVAGINRKTDDRIEQEGIRRSREKVAESDAVIFMIDGSSALEESDIEIYEKIRNKKKIIVINKIDLGKEITAASLQEVFPDEKIVEISVKKDINCEAVTGFLKESGRSIEEQASEYAVNNRQYELFNKLGEALATLESKYKSFSDVPELTAEEIRNCLKIIGELTGEVTVDNILNTIFSEFCVGK